jgi:hypothetical protein
MAINLTAAHLRPLEALALMRRLSATWAAMAIGRRVHLPAADALTSVARIIHLQRLPPPATPGTPWHKSVKAKLALARSRHSRDISSPRQQSLEDCQDEGRVPSMMIAIPRRQTLTPTQSVTVGCTLSTAHSHVIATAT